MRFIRGRSRFPITHDIGEHGGFTSLLSRSRAIAAMTAIPAIRLHPASPLPPPAHLIGVGSSRLGFRSTDVPITGSPDLSTPPPWLSTRISKELNGCIARYSRLAQTHLITPISGSPNLRYPTPYFFNLYCKQNHLHKSTLGPPVRGPRVALGWPNPKPNPGQRAAGSGSANCQLPAAKF